MREQEIQNNIRIAVSMHDCTIFRGNVGKVQMKNGRWFDTGLPQGFPDLFGFRHKDGKIFFIECKNENGKPRPDQIQFHHMLTTRKIIHGIARNEEDALKIIDGNLIGYGFNK